MNVAKNAPNRVFGLVIERILDISACTIYLITDEELTNEPDQSSRGLSPTAAGPLAAAGRRRPRPPPLPHPPVRPRRDPAGDRLRAARPLAGDDLGQGRGDRRRD